MNFYGNVIFHDITPYCTFEFVLSNVDISRLVALETLVSRVHSARLLVLTDNTSRDFSTPVEMTCIFLDLCIEHTLVTNYD